MNKEIDFIKAHNTRDLEEFIGLVFPEEWMPICARIIESGAEYSSEDRFAPKWTPIPYTERHGDDGLETALKSTIFRVHDCLHQLWGLPIPTAYDEDNFYQFKRAWMCAEVAVLTLTEFVYCKWLLDTQPQLHDLLMKRNTLLFKETTELKFKTTREIAARLDQLLHKKINPKWVRDNVHARLFLEDFVPMLEEDRVNIDHNWKLLKANVPLGELSALPNQRYSSHLDGLELTTWMIDDFYHLMGTDEQVDMQLKEFNKERRSNVMLPRTWNTPPKKEYHEHN
jgi:hypothetical protein